jgi:hypothetical protein
LRGAVSGNLIGAHRSEIASRQAYIRWAAFR